MGFLFMLRIIIVFISLAFSAMVEAQPKIGAMAPDIVLADQQGKVVSLHALRGKVVLIDFWASWCGPCRKSNRVLLPIYRTWKEKGFEIYGISLDQDPAAWQKAIADDQIRWLQFNENGGWDTPTASAWKIEYLPTSVLLDRNGKIISVDPSPEELRRYLRQALK